MSDLKDFLPVYTEEETNDLLGRKNAIINGDFNIWQRGTSFPAAVSYNADRFVNGNTSTAIMTVTRDTDVPTQAESGHKSNYSLKMDVTTADTNITGTEEVHFAQNIEGYNFTPFVGKTATLSFWVKAVKTGIYCVAFRNELLDRSYVSEYTINSANTWEKKTINVTFDYSGGGWDYTNGIGLRIAWILAYNGTAAPNQWNSDSFQSTSNQVNGVDSTDNNFWLAQVQFELGNTATDFEYRDIGTELALCQRYFEILTQTNKKDFAVGYYRDTTHGWYVIDYTDKRIIPTITYSDIAHFKALYNSGAIDILSMFFDETSTKGCRLRVEVSGVTLGRGTIVYIFSADGKIAIDAEL